jgi:hypothetical protein
MIRTNEVRAQADRLNLFLARMIAETTMDIYTQGHMGKYACVLAAGFLENALAEVFCVYVSGRAQAAVASFSCETLRKIQNPKSSRFLEITKRFSKNWEDELRVFLAENSDRRKSAIDTIMTNRHSIAHGKNSSITLRQVKNYLDASIEVIEFIESRIYLAAHNP